MRLHDISRDFIGRCVAEQDAYSWLRILCEEVGPRPSGSREERRATELVMGSLSWFGFQTEIEEFSFPGWQPGTSTVTVHAKSAARTVPSNPLGWCPGTSVTAAVAMMVELARLLQPYKLARTLRFMTFGSEEPGLLGSKAYIGSRKDLSQIVCVLNLDSTAIRDGTLTITTNENRGLHEFFLLLGSQLHLDLEMHEERTLYSDHDPFRERGVPCAAFLSLSPRYAFAHSLYDTLDKLSPESFTIPLIAAGVGVIECAMREGLVFAHAEATKGSPA